MRFHKAFVSLTTVAALTTCGVAPAYAYGTTYDYTDSYATSINDNTDRNTNSDGSAEIAIPFVVLAMMLGGIYWVATEVQKHQESELAQFTPEQRFELKKAEIESRGRMAPWLALALL